MSIRALLVLVVWLALGVMPRAHAHELRPGYLELRQTGAETWDVRWKVPARGDMRLALYPRFPDGSSALGEPVTFQDGIAFIERVSIICPGGLEGRRIEIDGLAATLTDVLVRVARSDGSTQTVRLTPTSPSFEVVASPSLVQTATAYLGVGVEHILLGVDHLLFVLGLLLIVRGRKQLIATITSFTLAHSITLGLATFGIANVPAPPLNAVIALSILFLGPEIVCSWRGESSFTLRHPWVVAFAFGLLHGFGFASGLATIGIPHAEVVVGLLWFNVGVELGQLAFVALVFALVRAFRVLEVRWPTWVARAPGYAIGVSGAYWTIERTSVLLGGR